MCESNADEQDSPQFIDPRLEGFNQRNGGS